MKKNDKDIQDIYRSEDSRPEPDLGWKTPELIERELRRQRIFNIFIGLLTLALTAFLTSAIVKGFLSEPEQTVPTKIKLTRFAPYTLPYDEQWALEYRQVASQADFGASDGAKEFSVKWVKNAAYHTIMGTRALQMNELTAAQDHLEATAKIFPAMTGIQPLLGEIYLKRQHFEKAVSSLQKALEEQPSINVLNNLGVAYMGIEDYVHAEPLLRQAVQQQPELAGCYKNLALLYQKTARTNDAIASFEKYFSLNPKDTALIKSYVAYLIEAGLSRSAIVFLEQLKGADPLTTHLLLAKTAAQQEDAELAVRALREASRFTTPRQTIAEMHDPAFDKIARAKPFEALLYRLELAAVSLSTNIDTKEESKD